jgi:hypothetical protein
MWSMLMAVALAGLGGTLLAPGAWSFDDGHRNERDDGGSLDPTWCAWLLLPLLLLWSAAATTSAVSTLRGEQLGHFLPIQGRSDGQPPTSTTYALLLFGVAALSFSLGLMLLVLSGLGLVHPGALRAVLGTYTLVSALFPATLSAVVARDEELFGVLGPMPFTRRHQAAASGGYALLAIICLICSMQGYGVGGANEPYAWCLGVVWLLDALGCSLLASVRAKRDPLGALGFDDLSQLSEVQINHDGLTSREVCC